MRQGHFETLRPVCPACRPHGRSSQLAVSIVEAEHDGDIVSGILGCASCGAEYPIVDGLPIIVADVRRYVQDNLFYLMARDDLPAGVESLLGDASGPGSGLDSIRQHVSSYTWDHWGDLDPGETGQAAGGGPPGSVARALAACLDMLDGPLPDGPVLDLGCGTGRSVAELAGRTGRTVLGIDISTPLARIARRALATGGIRYGRRRIGMVYDRRDFSVAIDGAEHADIWICDALALPFAPETFALAVGLNVLDCLTNPAAGLAEADRVLRPDGGLLLSVPFDWSAAATPVEGWIGGHSQRGPLEGRAETLLEMMLSEGPLAAGNLRQAGPSREIPWHVRIHERSCMHYQAHLVAARRVVGQNGGSGG